MWLLCSCNDIKEERDHVMSIIQVQCDIFELMDKNHIPCILTGGGCPAVAAKLFSHLPSMIGNIIAANGGFFCGLIDANETQPLFIFPTKINVWEDSMLEVVQKSLCLLKLTARTQKDKIFLLPRPGCGLGGLSWPSQIKPLLEASDLPRNIWICTNV